MIYNVLLTGVGGVGVLLTSIIIARAANFDNYTVRGIQFHGLAQRGGSIPIHIRFGKEVHSPTIPEGQADLILGLELIEALREIKYASKRRTHFIINTHSIKPIYTHVLKQSYPTKTMVKKALIPFAKKIIFVDAGKICREKFGNSIYGNIMILGVAHKAGMLPLSKKALVASLKQTLPRDLKQNIDAFEWGVKFLKRGI